MATESRASISTNLFGKSFLLKAWRQRNELLDYERRGFAQFFYLTICGHIESRIASLIKARIFCIRRMSKWESLSPMQFTSAEGVTTEHSVQPLVASLMKIVGGIGDEVDSAPPSKLVESYSKVFSVSLVSAIGRELNEDLNSLAILRNLFAHGRNLVMDFTGDPTVGYKGTLDENPIKRVASRLHLVGIIENFDITGVNYNDFLAVFYADDSLLHFYGAVQKIEAALEVSSTFKPENGWLPHDKLPTLDA